MSPQTTNLARLDFFFTLETLQTFSWHQGLGSGHSSPSPAALHLPGGSPLTHCPAVVVPGGTAPPGLLPPARSLPSPLPSTLLAACRTSFLT